mgnify:CR=1 FL=1
MDCRTAEGMVSRYIKHDLPLNELEEFLDHVQNCSSRILWKVHRIPVTLCL